MTTPVKSNRFINTIITVGATSLLLGAASVHAATNTQQQTHEVQQSQGQSRQGVPSSEQPNTVRGTDLTNIQGDPNADIRSERPVEFHQAFMAIIDAGISPDELQDRSVVNTLGDEIGEVQDVVMSNDGREAGIVVGVGGVLGIGEKAIFLSADELRAGPDGQEIVWERSLDEDAAEGLPEYDEERYTSLTEDA